MTNNDYLKIASKRIAELREEKRINKIKKKTEKKERKIAEGKLGKHDRGLKSKSKFSTKYSDRIASIREADAKAERKKKQRTARSKDRVDADVMNKKEFEIDNKRSMKNSKKGKTQKRKTTAKRFADTKNNNVKKKSREEIRAEMLKQLENSKLNDRK